MTLENSIILKIKTDACKGTETEVNYLEHVQAVVSVNATRRGDLEIFLTSPMGTRSMILSKRVNDDDHRDGFTKWPFMTTHTWGEYPQGTWTLEVCNKKTTIFTKNGTRFHHFVIKLFSGEIQFTTATQWMAKRVVIGFTWYKRSTISFASTIITTLQACDC